MIPGPFPPPTRRFHEIKLPADKHFRQLAGWGEHVLLLADEGLFEHDGTRIVRKIELCLEPAGVRDHYWLGPMRFGVSVWNGRTIAVVSPDGTAKCYPQTSNADYLPFALLMGITMTSMGLPNDTRPILGFAIPRDPDRPRMASLFAPRSDAIWLQVWPSQSDPDPVRTLRFDGKRWKPIGSPPPLISDIWIDPSGSVWALGSFYDYRFGPPPAGYDGARPTPLAREDGNGWRPVSTPQRFFADRVIGTSADDVWFLSMRIVYQWDGSMWHWEDFLGPMSAPIYRPQFPGITGVHDGELQVHAVSAAGVHMDPKGSLWVLGGTQQGGSIFRTDPKFGATSDAQSTK